MVQPVIAISVMFCELAVVHSDEVGAARGRAQVRRDGDVRIIGGNALQVRQDGGQSWRQVDHVATPNNGVVLSDDAAVRQRPALPSSSLEILNNGRAEPLHFAQSFTKKIFPLPLGRVSLDHCHGARQQFVRLSGDRDASRHSRDNLNKRLRNQAVVGVVCMMRSCRNGLDID